ncbi:MAG: RluA family pseudouridine synthase [Lachnospiraceae bacterium]|nr:RluA family pseudouridine synthase [Lachnospiraceae bacterium]
MNGTSYRFVVGEEQAGERLDVFLAGLFPDRSRTGIRKLIDEGAVTVSDGADAETDNGREAASGRSRKPSYAVREEDVISLTVPPDVPLDVQPENIPLDILYEDNDLLVVNKPKGMVVHPAPGHTEGTLVNAVLYHCGDSLSGIGGVLRPGIVHRIDRDTTGSLIICKNDTSHRGIAAQLAEHSLTRIYHALVIGRLPEMQGTIDKPIGRSRTDRKKMAVVGEGADTGKNAVTHYQVQEWFPGDNVSYVTCRLETGRTHQIRVHMASIGHPVLGDPVYGGDRKCRFKLNGQCLHAKTLRFVHPVTKACIDTEAPLPEYFAHLLSVLR